MKVRPHLDYVLILPDLPQEKSASGLIDLPPGWTQPPGTGTVIAVGRGRYDNQGVFRPTTLKPGDRVSYRWIDGREWEHDGRVYKFLRENEFWFVADNESAQLPVQNVGGI